MIICEGNLFICFVCSYNKSQQDALFLKFIFVTDLHMFQTDLLSIIRSFNTVYAAIGICHASYVDCLLARSGWTVDLSETCRVIKNKFE